MGGDKSAVVRCFQSAWASDKRVVVILAGKVVLIVTYNGAIIEARHARVYAAPVKWAAMC